jgi:hypothetical protein
VAEFAAVPTGKPAIGTNPKGAVPSHRQRPDQLAGKTFTARRRPLDWTDAVEANQSELGTDPEVTIRGLSKRVGNAPEKASTDCPGVVRVLIDIERRVQSKRIPERPDEYKYKHGDSLRQADR